MMEMELNPKFVEFTLQQFYAAHAFPSGLFHMRMDVNRAVDFVSGEFTELVATLTGCVLAEQAGPVEHDETIYNTTNFPRWLPKWVQRRWTKPRTITLKVTPKFIYPSSNLTVPEIGKPIVISTKEIDRHYEEEYEK